MLDIAPLIPHVSPLIDRAVRIVKYHRRVGGQVGIVRDLFWKGNEPWLVIQLTSGRRVAVAYGWTDLPPEACPTQMTEPELLPSGLLEMALYWRGMQAHRPARRFPTRPKRT
jgi:hypothetical protein